MVNLGKKMERNGVQMSGKLHASRKNQIKSSKTLLDEEVTPTPLTLFNLFNGQAAFCLGLNSKSPASGSNSAGGARIVTRRLCGSHHLGLI